MSQVHTYEVNVEWDEKRKGTMSSPALNDKIEVATPPEFPKGMEGIWSPEHLYVASVNSCLMTTFLAIAENSKLEFTDFNCKAVGTLEKVDGKFAISEITLYPEVTITREKDLERARRILEKSEAACLISKSVKTEIHLDPKMTIGELAS